MRVVLDTNVLVSVFLFHGALGNLYDAVDNEVCVPCFTESTFSEFAEVVSREKFRNRIGAIRSSADEIIDAIREKSLLYPECEIERVVHLDPKDDKFLACAVSSQADFIVSGDRHLLELGSYEDMPIVTPREFLQKITHRNGQ